jgi:tungstate transport system ATP-binding protein
VLDLTAVTVCYDGRGVLSVPGLSVQRGEILSVVGPNGAGKSTLLRVLGLLERPTTGVVVFDGRPVRYEAGTLVAARRRMAAVFQAPLLCDTSVAANIGMGLRFRGVPPGTRDGRIRRWAEAFGIAHVLDRRALTLSGGEAQRASLARAFALEPEVLLLDEPFAALDAPTRESVLRDLEAVLGDERVTTIFVTHDRSEALRLGDRVAVMMGGGSLSSARPGRSSRARRARGLPGSSGWTTSSAAPSWSGGARSPGWSSTGSISTWPARWSRVGPSSSASAPRTSPWSPRTRRRGPRRRRTCCARSSGASPPTAHSSGSSSRPASP